MGTRGKGRTLVCLCCLWGRKTFSGIEDSNSSGDADAYDDLYRHW
jgi:hypothetical protein